MLLVLARRSTLYSPVGTVISMAAPRVRFGPMSQRMIGANVVSPMPSRVSCGSPNTETSCLSQGCAM
ncbi:hypothetical protein D9M71_513460 [compost metagenome]